MSSSQSVLVVGGDELGTAVITYLLTHPQRESTSIRLAMLWRAEILNSTDPSTQSELARLTSRGVTFEAGDVDTSPISGLAATFGKYDVVIQCAGYGRPPSVQRRVTQAVLEAGSVRRYFPWQFGVDYEAIGAGGSSHALFDELLEIRRILRSSHGKTKWTIISTGLFMSFLFLPDFGVVNTEEKVVRALGSWANKVTVTTPEDIGRMVAEMVYVPEGTANRVVYIGGDTVSYSHLAEVLEGVYGEKFRREVWDTDYLKKRLQEEPDNMMLKYQNTFAAGVGVSWDRAETLNGQRGIDLTGVEQYVRQEKK